MSYKYTFIDPYTQTTIPIQNCILNTLPLNKMNVS